MTAVAHVLTIIAERGEGGGCSVCGYIFILLEESVDSTCFVLDICINECG